MKKILLVVFLLVSVAVFGQQAVSISTVTITWDEVTTLIDGSPIPTGDTVSYRVWMSDSGMPDQLVGDTTGTDMVITFPTEGKYNIGVRTVRLTASGFEVVSMWAIMEVEYRQLPSEPGSLRLQ